MHSRRIPRLTDSSLPEFEQIYVTEHCQLIHSSLVIHTLLHVGQCIRQNGPLMCYSQFTCERYIGSLKRTIKSYSHPFANMLNNARSRAYESVIRQNSSIEVKAEHVAAHQSRYVTVTAGSWLFGPMYNVPFDELSMEEQASLRACYPQGELESEFRLEAGQIWQNYQAENGDSIGSLLDVGHKTNTVYQRRFAKVARACAANDGSIFVLVDFYYVLQQADDDFLTSEATDQEGCIRDFWARIRYLRADREAVPTDCVISCQNWEIDRAGQPVSNFGETCWIPVKDIECLIGVIQADRKLYVIDRTPLSRGLDQGICDLRDDE